MLQRSTPVGVFVTPLLEWPTLQMTKERDAIFNLWLFGCDVEVGDGWKFCGWAVLGKSCWSKWEGRRGYVGTKDLRATSWNGGEGLLLHRWAGDSLPQLAAGGSNKGSEQLHSGRTVWSTWSTTVCNRSDLSSTLWAVCTCCDQGHIATVVIDSLVWNCCHQRSSLCCVHCNCVKLLWSKVYFVHCVHCNCVQLLCALCTHCNPCESRAANSRSLSAHKRVCVLGWVTICQTLSIVFVYLCISSVLILHSSPSARFNSWLQCSMEIFKA